MITKRMMREESVPENAHDQCLFGTLYRYRVKRNLSQSISDISDEPFPNPSSGSVLFEPVILNPLFSRCCRDQN